MARFLEEYMVPIFYIIFHIQYEKRMNTDIKRIYNGPNIQKCLFSKRLECAGHISRDKDSLIIQVLVIKLNKTRTTGRSYQRWIDQVNKELFQVVKTARIEDPDNRDQWRVLVDAAKGMNSF